MEWNETFYILFQESGKSGLSASPFVGNHESGQHGGGASGQSSVGVCPLVLHYAFPHILPGILHSLPLLLPQRRGN